MGKPEEEKGGKAKELQDVSTETIHTGNYVSNKTKNDENYFNLKTTYGQTILSNQLNN